MKTMLTKITSIIIIIILLLPQSGLCLRPVATRISSKPDLSGNNRAFISIDDIFATGKPFLTEEIVMKRCKNGKSILWSRYTLSPEFARWILKIVAENPFTHNKRPEDVTTHDFIHPMAILNNHQISFLLEHPDLYKEGMLINRKAALEKLKLLAGYTPATPLLTKEIVIECCKNGKSIPWSKCRLSPEFARWILKIVVENPFTHNNRPEDVNTHEFIQPIAILNNHQISSLLEHPDLQEEGMLMNRKAALEILKLLAGYTPATPLLTKEIVIECCKNGKSIPWSRYRLSPEFARWILKIVAENTSYGKKPEDVKTSDFRLRIRALNNRIVMAILSHPNLGRKENPFIGYADALKRLKLLAGYNIKEPETVEAYEEPVDNIISDDTKLDNITYNQIVQLIGLMRKGNLTAKERIQALFNRYFENIYNGLKYRLYRNYYLNDKEGAEKEFYQELYIKYEKLIKGLKTERLKKDYWIAQIKFFLRTSLTRHYYSFYNKLQKRGYNEKLILNGSVSNGKNSNHFGVPNGKNNNHFDKDKEMIDNISNTEPSQEDILNAVGIMQKLISVMKEKKISTRDISLFFDYYLSGLTQRELSFKYFVSRSLPHFVVMEKIHIVTHISKQDIYFEFLKKAQFIKDHIDYVLIIEQYPPIRIFRKTLRKPVYSQESIKAVIFPDTRIVARAFSFSA